MYKLIATISTLIRQFCLSNPFEALGEGLMVNVGDGKILISPELLNWIAEPFMHTVTYAIVGVFYDRGDDPAIGSFLYLLFYCIHTFLIWLMSLTGFAAWAVIIIVILYIGVHFVLREIIIRYL